LSSGVKESLQHGEVRCAEEEVTHTHTHTLPTITDHHTAAVLNTMSPLCDGIQCRLTAGTGGSAKGEILAVKLRKELTDRVKNRNTINKIGHKGKL